MNTSSRTNTPASARSLGDIPKPGDNWAPFITDQIEAVGCTVEGLPEHVTGEQAEAFFSELQRQLAEYQSASA